MSSLNRKALFKTDAPPCCLRINPLHPHIVYFGTYTLVEGIDRKGSIEIWEISPSGKESNGDLPDSGEVNVENLPLKATKLRVIETHGAVLDIKIDTKSVNSSDDSMLITTAHSTGNITFWKLKKDDPINLSEVSDLQLFPEPTSSSDETLITSVNFHPRSNKLCFTTTTGYVGYYDYDQLPSVDDGLFVFDTQHSLEAWYADWAHDPQLDDIIFSGGDDAQLIAHDIREPLPIFTTSRIHDAGIVSILTTRKGWCEDVTDPYMIWTGGYDDQLCVLDLRAGKNISGGTLFNGMPPIAKEKHNLNGGVWRLIPSPRDDDYRVLTCNMYDGGRIVSYDPSNAQNVEVVGTYKGEHSSITYGGDWVGDVIVSCSFYDNVVQVWDGSKA
jgi:diphthamide biosynthesis protein 7